MFELCEEYFDHKKAADGLNYHIKTVRTIGIPFFHRWLGVKKVYAEYFGCGTWRRVAMKRCGKSTQKWLSDVLVSIRNQEFDQKFGKKDV